ncbi:LapA family protein [Sporolituus thermophilus]|nr:LapA family protein [Sporolituus thermophilus]
MRFLFLSFVFALLVAIFAVQNSLPVTVSFLMWSFQTSLVIIILGAATFGALVIVSLATLAQFRLKRTIHQLRQRLSDLETENNELKAKLNSGAAQVESDRPAPEGQAAPSVRL